MEWLKKLLEKHIKEGKLDTEAFMTELAVEFPKNAVPKNLYNDLSDTKKKLETDLQDRDKQLEDLKKVDAAGLQAEITRLQSENKTAKEKYDADLKDATLSNAIKLAVAGKVHDENLVSGLVDKSKLVIDGDKVVGLDDQLKSLQESKAFLFKGEEGETQSGFKVGSDGKATGTASNDQLAAIFGNTATKQ